MGSEFKVSISKEQMGIIPRAIHSIFETINDVSNASDIKYTLSLSYLEVTIVYIILKKGFINIMVRF